jgi:translation initiation factor 2B subunit (eIF-2B alpha/beta/delta family)
LKLQILIFLGVVSAVIILLFVRIMHVILMVKSDEEEILKLFIDIPVKDIEDYISKCQRFIRELHKIATDQIVAPKKISTPKNSKTLKRRVRRSWRK